MRDETWSLTAQQLCDSCKTASSAVFCRADSAFLCLGCDSEVHAANKLSSRHARVWVCEVCERAPAAVTCKADSAALCSTCDRDIHSANHLAHRHERLPVIPFYDSVPFERSSDPAAEEAEAASWLLLPNPNDKPADYLFTYLDVDLLSSEQKPHAASEQNKQFSVDGVVPVQNKNEFESGQYPDRAVDGFQNYETDYGGSKPFMYNFSSAQSISQSISSSSLDTRVVPDHSGMADVSDSFGKAEPVPVPVSGFDREARVLRYREKRKNRKFEKTIRYASRKAYAETRPRIKGRFVKRAELHVDSLIAADALYGVVPSF